MAFKKGDPPGPGRPEGSKNKNYMVPSMWLELIWDAIQTMEPSDQIPVAKWAVEQMMPKVPVLPATPGDSTHNAAAALAELEFSRKQAPIETPPSAQELDIRGVNGSNGLHTD